MTLPEHLRDGLLSLVGTGGPKEYAHFPPGQPPELYLFPAPKDAGDLPDDDERAGRPVEPQSAAARG